MRHRLSIRELPGWAPFLERDPSLLPRVFRSPSPNHGERMIGKRYMRGCTKILGPARKKSGPKWSSLFSPNSKVSMKWMYPMTEWPMGVR